MVRGVVLPVLSVWKITVAVAWEPATTVARLAGITLALKQ